MARKTSITLGFLLLAGSFIYACSGNNQFTRSGSGSVTTLDVQPTDTDGNDIADSFVVNEIPGPGDPAPQTTPPSRDITPTPTATPTVTPTITPTPTATPVDECYDDDCDEDEDGCEGDNDDECESDKNECLIQDGRESVCTLVKVISEGVSSARVTLNCERVVREQDFHNEDYLVIERESVLFLGENQLTVDVKLRGSPGDILTVELYTCENEPELLFSKTYERSAGPPTEDIVVIEE